MQPRPRGDDRRRRQVHQAPRRLQVGLRVARPRRHRQPTPGRSSARSRPRRSSSEGAEQVLAGVDGMLVPGGFGIARHRGQDRGDPLRPRDAACRSSASAWACSARRSSSPATCSAWRTPTAPSSTRRRQHPVVCLLDEQYGVTQARRDDAARAPDPATCCPETPGPRRRTAPTSIDERHRHRYEFNNDYREQFEEHGLVVSGTSPDGDAGRGDRAARPPVVPGRAVPPRVQVEADAGAPAVPRLRRGRPRTPRGGPRRARGALRRSATGRAGRGPGRKWTGSRDITRRADGGGSRSGTASIAESGPADGPGRGPRLGRVDRPGVLGPPAQRALGDLVLRPGRDRRTRSRRSSGRRPSSGPPGCARR